MKNRSEEMFRLERQTKRLAFLNGCTGQAGRIVITGQFFEVPVTAEQLEESWNPFLNLPLSSLRTIRPVTDIGISRLKECPLRVIVTERLDSDPEQPIFDSGVVRTDDNGAFRVSMVHSIPAGDFFVRVIETQDGQPNLRREVGAGKIRILPEDYEGPIVTSDIDRTFLNTNLESTRGMIETLFETPDMKSPLTGMAEIYRLLNRESIPLYFLSASPHFYRRTLLSVFHLHGIDPTGLHLKSLIDSLEGVLNKILFSFKNFDKFISDGIIQAFERSIKFLGSSYQSFFDQVAYKLTALLEHRLMQPTRAKEILIGDNSESDFFIFSVYQILLMGFLSTEETEAYLYNLRFHGREAFTRDSAKRIAALATESFMLHGAVNTVKAVWINRAEPEPDEYLMRKQVRESLPHAVRDRSEAILIEPRSCCGSIDFVALAYDAGLFDAGHLRKFWRSLIEEENNVPALRRKARVLIETLDLRNTTGDEILKIFQ